MDDSDSSAKTAAFAVDEMARAGDLFHVVTVVPKAEYTVVGGLGGGIVLPPTPEEEAQLVDEARAFIERRAVHLLRERQAQ